MKKYLQKLVFLMVAMAVTATGIQGCSGEDNPLLILLGEEAHPSSKADIAGVSDAYCDPSCDGELTPPVSSVKGFGASDADFDTLMGVVVHLGFWPIFYNYDNVRDAYSSEFEDLATDYFGDLELMEDQEAFYGPLYGTMNLDTVCAPGTGQVLYGRRDGFVGAALASASPKGPPWGDFFYQRETFSLTLNNCEIAGDLLDDMADSVVTLSGHVTFTVEEDYMEDQRITTANGALVVNPGLSEPMISGTDPTPVWGYNAPMVFDVHGEESGIVGFETSDGGVCHDGVNASSAENCDGYFMTADEFSDILFD